MEGLPAWMGPAQRRRLLGPSCAADLGGDAWSFDAGGARASCTTRAAADVAARLRGVVLEGEPLSVSVVPKLNRSAVRAARTEDARRRRETTPGFSRRGVRLDAEGRWSLTPERLAKRMARWAAAQGVEAVIDAGCGAGGNAIAFARAGLEVVAVEADAGRLAMARHNARLYGVADALRLVHGDAVEGLPELLDALGPARTLVFFDPPWGGDDSKQRTEVGDFPLLAAALPRVRALGCAGAWAKLPPGVRSSTFEATWGEAVHPRAVFGEAAGDRRRIKFVLISTLPWVAPRSAPRSSSSTR